MTFLDISIKYGDQTLSRFIPSGRGRIQVIDSPNVLTEITDLEKDLVHALENPIQSAPLKELVAAQYRVSGQRVILIADDNTRPNLHTQIIYPLLLPYLIDVCGVNKEDLGILIASGTHRPPTEIEIRERILGNEIYEEYQDQILIHNDKDNLANLGVSSSNTPITINKNTIDACLLIPVTDSEYHYFAGVAGTVKQLFPGVAGRVTINTNHTRMFDKEKGFKPACRLGNTKDNPVITDLKEMAEKVQEYTPVFCIDAIMDYGKITSLNAGNIIALHDLANELLFDRRVIHVDSAADLVIVSVGKFGFNLYQATKGIHAAWNAAKKPDGTVLLLAPCQDGAGATGYQETMEAIRGMDLDTALRWVIDNTCGRDTFRIGNQKPVDTLRMLKTLGENQIKILSKMDPDELINTFRIAAIPDLGSPLESLKGFVSQFLDNTPDALVYILQDSGLYIIPDDEK